MKITAADRERCKKFGHKWSQPRPIFSRDKGKIVTRAWCVRCQKHTDIILRVVDKTVLREKDW